MNTKNHPCFNIDAKEKYARIHLPVATSCNVQCRFCNRCYDCINESRPGVTSTVLSPEQAFMYFKHKIQSYPEISVVGIAGPGDSMADAEKTIKTIALIRKEFPDILFCVATNGLALSENIKKLVELSVSHITVTVNAVDPQIGAKIYSWIRWNKKVYRGIEGASVMWEQQKNGIAQAVAAGMIVKINCVIIPDVNDKHYIDVAREVSALGAHMMNCIPMIPAKDSDFEGLRKITETEIQKIRNHASTIIPQMTYCSQCRADACGLIGKTNSNEQIMEIANFAKLNTKNENRPYVAVATREGLLVNRHLGEADEFIIYKQNGKLIQIESVRKAPPPGTGELRWKELAKILNDCKAILVSGVGPTPKKILTEEGIEIKEMEGLIEEGLKAIFSNEEIPPFMKRRFAGCGKKCEGTGNGCS